MQQPLKTFGASDAIACPACGTGWKYVTRRSPGDVSDSERQTLTCIDCGDTLDRIVDAVGSVLTE